jgi:shikimate kinase
MKDSSTEKSFLFAIIIFMNLIFIYGPPAAGKLTVAEELAKQTGYKLFHNHLTMDLVRELYPEFSDLRFKLADRLRLNVFAYAAENNTNLIFTYVHDGDTADDSFTKEVIETIDRSGGNVLFVELTAPDNILLDRVSNESRRRFHKLKDPQILKAQLDQKLYSASLTYPNILKIDTSTMNPSQAVSEIISRYKLA